MGVKSLFNYKLNFNEDENKARQGTISIFSSPLIRGVKVGLMDALTASARTNTWKTVLQFFYNHSCTLLTSQIAGLLKELEN